MVLLINGYNDSIHLCYQISILTNLNNLLIIFLGQMFKTFLLLLLFIFYTDLLLENRLHSSNVSLESGMFCIEIGKKKNMIEALNHA